MPLGPLARRGPHGSSSPRVLLPLDCCVRASSKSMSDSEVGLGSRVGVSLEPHHHRRLPLPPLRFLHCPLSLLPPLRQPPAPQSGQPAVASSQRSPLPCLPSSILTLSSHPRFLSLPGSCSFSVCFSASVEPSTLCVLCNSPLVLPQSLVSLGLLAG